MNRGQCGYESPFMGPHTPNRLEPRDADPVYPPGPSRQDPNPVMNSGSSGPPFQAEVTNPIDPYDAGRPSQQSGLSLQAEGRGPNAPYDGRRPDRQSGGFQHKNQDRFRVPEKPLGNSRLQNKSANPGLRAPNHFASGLPEEILSDPGAVCQTDVDTHSSLVGSYPNESASCFLVEAGGGEDQNAAKPAPSRGDVIKFPEIVTPDSDAQGDGATDPGGSPDSVLRLSPPQAAEASDNDGTKAEEETTGEFGVHRGASSLGKIFGPLEQQLSTADKHNSRGFGSVEANLSKGGYLGEASPRSPDAGENYVVVESRASFFNPDLNEVVTFSEKKIIPRAEIHLLYTASGRSQLRIGDCMDPSTYSHDISTRIASGQSSPYQGDVSTSSPDSDLQRSVKTSTQKKNPASEPYCDEITFLRDQAKEGRKQPEDQEQQHPSEDEEEGGKDLPRLFFPRTFSPSLDTIVSGKRTRRARGLQSPAAASTSSPEGIFRRRPRGKRDPIIETSTLTETTQTSPSSTPGETQSRKVRRIGLDSGQRIANFTFTVIENGLSTLRAFV